MDAATDENAPVREQDDASQTSVLTIREWCDRPLVRSGIDGVDGAMSVQAPMLAPVRAKKADWSSPTNGPPPGPALAHPVLE